MERGGGMAHARRRGVLRLLFALHATLGQLLHHFDELLAVVLEEVVCHGENSPFRADVSETRHQPSGSGEARGRALTIDGQAVAELEEVGRRAVHRVGGVVVL